MCVSGIILQPVFKSGLKLRFFIQQPAQGSCKTLVVFSLPATCRIEQGFGIQNEVGFIDIHLFTFQREIKSKSVPESMYRCIKKICCSARHRCPYLTTIGREVGFSCWVSLNSLVRVLSKSLRNRYIRSAPKLVFTPVLKLEKCEISKFLPSSVNLSS